MTQTTSNAWFESVPPGQSEILNRLRLLIFEAVPDAIEELKWSRPCYSTSKGLFCYLGTTKGHATLGFQKGTSLPDPNRLLEGSGKEMRHIKLRSLDDIDEPAFKATLQQAQAL